MQKKANESPNYILALELAKDLFFNKGNRWSSIVPELKELYPDLTDADIDELKSSLEYQMKQHQIQINSCDDCTKYQVTGDKLPGGKADGLADEEFNKAQLELGMLHEKEHTQDPEIAKEISKDHLVEDAEYYTHLNDMEKHAFFKSAEPQSSDTYSPGKFDPNQAVSDYEQSKIQNDEESPEDAAASREKAIQEATIAFKQKFEERFAPVEGIVFTPVRSFEEAFKDGIISLTAAKDGAEFARLNLNVVNDRLRLFFAAPATYLNVKLFHQLYNTLQSRGFHMDYSLNESFDLENAKRTLFIQYYNMVKNIAAATGMTADLVHNRLMPFYGQSSEAIAQTLFSFPELFPDVLQSKLETLFKAWGEKRAGDDSFMQALDEEIQSAKNTALSVGF